MNKFMKMLALSATLALQTYFANAQITPAFFAPDNTGRTNANITAIGIGNFTTPQLSAFHVSTHEIYNS